jgi:hypothetical protein
MTVLLVGQEVLTELLLEPCPHLDPRTAAGPLLDALVRTLDELAWLQGRAGAPQRYDEDPAGQRN